MMSDTFRISRRRRYLIGMITAVVFSCFLLPCTTFAKQIPKKSGSLKYKTIKHTKLSSVNKSRKSKSLAIVQDTDIPFKEEVQKYIGIPYKRGGTGKSGIDCSGLTKKFYSDVFGIDLPHSSYEQSMISSLERVPLSVDSLQPSDLLFFTNSKKKKINHVGIYLSEGKFMHATPNGGVIISDLNQSAYYMKHLVASRRLKNTILAKAMNSTYDTAVSGKEILVRQNIGVGYSTPSNEPISVKVETFYDRNLSAKDDVVTWPVNLLSDNVDMNVPMDVETWQGMRASADIRPVDGMRITPSVSMVDGASLPENGHRRWQTYGVEAAISPTGSAWSLALSLHSLFSETYYDTYPDVTTGTDMGLRFNYQISDAIRFSMNSTWEGVDTDDSSRIVTDSLNENPDVSFNLGFSF